MSSELTRTAVVVTPLLMVTGPGELKVLAPADVPRHTPAEPGTASHSADPDGDGK